MNELKKIGVTLLILVAAIGCGVLLYRGVGKLEEKRNSNPEAAVIPSEPAGDVSAEPSPAPTGEPSLEPAEEPSPKPSVQPVSTPESVETNSGAIGSNDILSREMRNLLKQDSRPSVKVKGIYVSGPRAGSEAMNDLIRLVDETELNAMVIDIKNDSGEITYKMELPAAQEINATVGYIRNIKDLVQTLKDKNIYLIARIVAFKDPILAKNKTEFSIKNKDGSIFKDKDGLAWVNPYNKGVWNYLVDVAKEAVYLGFDEIQFDYIRFSTDKGMKNVDFGEDAGKMTKQEAINGFTSYAYEQLMPLGAFVSADVYGAIISSRTDEEIVGQNYYQMASGLDYICPMIYPSHYSDGAYQIDYPDTKPYELISSALEDSRKTMENNMTEHQAVVRPWLQDFTATWLTHHIKYDKEAIRAQIQAVYDAGYEEWILWNGSNRYTEDAFLR